VSRYGPVLALIHDRGYGGFAKGIAPGLLNLLHRQGIRGGRIVDLGCGSGIWAARLVEAGYDVVGVDASPDMIALARRAAPGATFHVTPFESYELPACSAITALGEVLCFLDARDSPSPDLARFFDRAAAALLPGGMLIFDLALLGLDRGRKPVSIDGEGWTCKVGFEYDFDRHRLGRQIEARWHSDSVITTETHWLQLFDRDEVVAQLQSAEFLVESAASFGEYPLLPGRVGFVGRQPDGP
jgi:SAM-dependent methyltransferase